MKKSADKISDDLARIACRSVIREAACILSGIKWPASHFHGWEIIGADEVLVRQDGKDADREERTAYKRWSCCRDLGVDPDDLTLLDVISWMLNGEGDPDYDPEDEECDCVTYEQVTQFVFGSNQAQPRSFRFTLQDVPIPESIPFDHMGTWGLAYSHGWARGIAHANEGNP